MACGPAQRRHGDRLGWRELGSNPAGDRAGGLLPISDARHLQRQGGRGDRLRCARQEPPSLIRVDTTRYRDLESLMAAMIEADGRYRHSVAWVDSRESRAVDVIL
jgi:hypothetical protein